MEIDVVYVTYNSIKWIEACFSSWENIPEKASMHLYIVDNGSTDETLNTLNKIKKKTGDSFADFQIIFCKENYGFGVANNIAASYGKSDYICFLNIDTEIQVNTMTQLIQYINQSSDMVGIWELRQIPFEHPKYYDPVTLETTWSSGAAFVIRRSVFEKIDGFDPHFFMYAEDVDLSWKVRKTGYTILYCPKAVIRHNSYVKKNEIKALQYNYNMRNNLLMRRRYGTAKDVMQGWILFFKLLLSNKMGWQFNRRFTSVVLQYFKIRRFFQPTKEKSKVAFFYGLNYSKVRYGAFQEVKAVKYKNIFIWTFILNQSSEEIEKVEKCMMHQTVSSKKIYSVQNLHEICEYLDYMEENLNIWFNIIYGKRRVFADHNEFGMEIISNCNNNIVGTVDEKGYNGRDLSYYFFNLCFYKTNHQLFRDNNYDEIIKLFYNSDKIGKKQTVL